MKLAPAGLHRFLVLVPAMTAIVIAQASQANVERYSEQARHALAAKDWQQASQALRNLAALTPAVPEVQANLGMAYYFQGRAAEAAAAFERALRLNAKLPQAKLMLGLCYADLGRNQDAVAILQPAFSQPPDKEAGRLVGLSLQRAYSQLLQFDKSVGVSDELLKRYPDDPEILFESSRLHADRSYELMRQLVRVAPHSPWVHHANAQVHESLQRYDLAVEEYRTVIRMKPQLPGIHFRLGRAILLRSKDQGNMDQAMHEFEQELAIAPRNSDAEYEIAEMYRERGQLEPALEHFSRAVRYHPEFVEAQIGLSRTLIKMGRAQEALPHLLDAVRLDPENKVAHFMLASAYKSLGNASSSQHELALYQKLRETRSSALRPSGAVTAQETTE